jgi:hypothetical protein
MATNDRDSSISQFKEDLLNQLKVDAESFVKASNDLSKYATQVNNLFSQGRQRILELQTAIADTTPGITRMGGDITNVADIIGKVADASKRNVIASAEEVEKLYASYKVLGLGADTLTNAFLNVGAGIETIGDTLEESVNYIQSIGGNAKAVMQDVNANMEQMNRYQFEGGVLGLTKMAAQASMLRFDMSQTFQLAEKVLSPEGAIETAAAFQRLGVAAGTLVDPFALMNASINDPGALQDSLVDVAKQFTYFDEKTKTFKINPQGVLTLKELQNQTGVSAAEMSKLGLAAAEADKRISAVGAAGLNIKEDDKQYLANIARMGEGGEYEVKIRNEEGKEETRKLQEITQTEFENLIKEQRERPKDMEEIARSQMKLSEVMLSDVAAIRAKIVGGVVSAGQVVQTKEDIRSGITNVTGEVSKMGDTASVRKPVEAGLSDIKKLIDDLKEGDNYTEDVAKYLENSGKLLGKIEEDFKKSLEETGEKISKGFEVGSNEQKLTDMLRGKIGETEASQQAAGNQTVSSFLEGRQNQMREVEAASSASAGSQRTQIELVGGIKMDITFNGDTAGFTPAMKEQLAKELTNKFNSMDYKQFMTNVTTNQNPTKGPLTQTLIR